jgi:bifunctional DNase/RNase
MRAGAVELTYFYNALKNPPPDRPVVHTVMASAIRALGRTIRDIVVDAFENQVFYAKLRVIRADRLVEVDLRPADAFTLAVDCGVPILIAESVLRKIEN